MSESKTSLAAKLAAPAVIGFFVLDRFLALGYLLPEYCLEDENWIREGALRMAFDSPLDPGTHKYPQLPFAIVALAYRAMRIAGGEGALDFVHAVLAGRAVSAALGALALWLFHRLLRKFETEQVALLATLFLASAPAMLFSCNVMKTDSLLLVGVMLALHGSLRVLASGKKRDYLLAGAALGFCLAAKYHPVAAVPMLVAHRLRHAEIGALRAFLRPEWLLMPAAALAGFVLLSPHSLIDARGLFGQGLIEIGLQNSAIPLLRRSPDYWWHRPGLFQIIAVLPFAAGLPLYLCSLAGAALKLDLRDRRRLVVFSYAAAFLVFMAAVSNIGFIHLYLPAVPFLALLAASFVGSELARDSRLRSAAALLAAAIICLHNIALQRGFAANEEGMMRNSTIEMVNTHEDGMKDIALVPYRANPDAAWPIEFHAQFLLNEKSLREADPDRILLHHAFYNAYLNNKELLSDPALEDMTLAYLHLRGWDLGYRESLRWPDFPILAVPYRYLLPDLGGMRVSIYTRLDKDTGKPPGQ